MKIKLTTMILLILCALSVGWSAYENLMWAVGGRRNFWYEYVGFAGCPVMFVSGLIALKSLRAGSILGLAGYVMMLFYFIPAILGTIYFIQSGQSALGPLYICLMTALVSIPVLTGLKLLLNLRGGDSRKSA